MLLTAEEARRITDRLLGMVTAEDAAVGVTSQMNSNLRFSANTLQTSGRVETVTARMTVWIDRRRGASSTTDLSDASLRQMAEQAHDLARLSPVDREYLPTIGPQRCEPTRRVRRGNRDAVAADRARAVDEALTASEKANVISAGFHQAEATAGATATKNGNFNYERGTIASLGMTARPRRRRIRILPAQPYRRAPNRHRAGTARRFGGPRSRARRADDRRQQLSGDPRGAGGRRSHLGLLAELRCPVG